jgi:hypothetical protein
MILKLFMSWKLVLIVYVLEVGAVDCVRTCMRERETVRVHNYKQYELLFILIPFYCNIIPE